MAPDIPSRSKLLAGIDEPQQELISRAADKRKAVAGDTIIRGGEKAMHLFLLVAGRAKYYRVTREGQEILLRWLSPGDAFGLATFLPSPPGYIGGVEVVDDCEILVWQHQTIRDLSGTYPLLAQNALRITLDYLSAYADRHAALVSRTAEQRLAHTLVHLGHRAGNPKPSGMEVAITNEQLGGLADVGLFTASRLLSGWEREGAISKKRGKVIIQSPEKLPLD